MQRRGGVAIAEHGKKRHPVYTELQRQKKAMDLRHADEVHSERQERLEVPTLPDHHSGSCVYCLLLGAFLTLRPAASASVSSDSGPTCLLCSSRGRLT